MSDPTARSAETIERIREEVLLSLHAAASTGLTAGLISRELIRAGYAEASEQVITTQLELLERTGCVSHRRGTLNTAVRRWSLTARGHEYLAECGLA